ncbi:hypothetical protein ACOZ06_004312 [Cronobacter muytjensii]|uniref:Uncharacterized protein n=1 Tax=Cronobacter muytjensii TaxID=413501 RepID=A0ABQ6U4T3_9ENTR|nr:hypothetical protein [Cronobacter muytjensii]EKS1845265.1 hypothetical protein [Cronobacter muytjensii]EKS1847283.1 hypothetical protein [Cronobacter muytjensii]ELY3983128.1 hypothetical protein [Cronobacter muytjensii]ELY3986035.1 hypothetical protein [Cronobacter muytjensii]ELY6273937.1 hypothetical protein [Cronobacter muytjensii]
MQGATWRATGATLNGKKGCQSVKQIMFGQGVWQVTGRASGVKTAMSTRRKTLNNAGLPQIIIWDGESVRMGNRCNPTIFSKFDLFQICNIWRSAAQEAQAD